MSSSAAPAALSSIIGVLQLVERALADLGAAYDLRQVEAIGTLVHEAMSLDTRQFHDVAHAVMVARSDDAVECLAGLFHDVVYHHVDGMFAPGLEALIHPFVTSGEDGLRLVPQAWASDRWAQITLDLFGQAPDEPLRPNAGQNELLSALVAARALEALLDDEQLVQVLACIESTIPFRGPGDGGLGERLSALDARFGLALPGDVVARAMQRAVSVANRDVGSFAAADVRDFLGPTWLLFAESNAALRRRRGFLVGDYRRSLVSALGFFESLDAGRVFCSHGGFPPTRTMASLSAKVRENLDYGILYLKMKIVSIAVVEALARLTGGDTLIALFMGHVRFGDGLGRRMEDYLPAVKSIPPEAEGEQSPLYQLLVGGRAHGGFDMTRSPLAVFMHDRLGQDELIALYPHADAMLAGRDTPQEFLRRVRGDVLMDIAHACGCMAWTRKTGIEQMMASLAAG